MERLSIANRQVKRKLTHYRMAHFVDANVLICVYGAHARTRDTASPAAYVLHDVGSGDMARAVGGR